MHFLVIIPLSPYHSSGVAGKLAKLSALEPSVNSRGSGGGAGGRVGFQSAWPVYSPDGLTVFRLGPKKWEKLRKERLDTVASPMALGSRRSREWWGWRSPAALER